MTLHKHILFVAALCAPLALAACSKEQGSGCDPNAPNTICTIAGVGASGFSGDNGPATMALLYTPQATATGPDGQLWLLDYNNYLVRSIDGKGIIHTRVGLGELGDSPDTMNGQLDGAPRCKRSSTTRRTWHFHGNFLYLAAWHASWIKKVDLTTMEVTDVAGEEQAHALHRRRRPCAHGRHRSATVQWYAVAANGDIVFMDQAKSRSFCSIDASGNINRIAGTCLISYYDLGEAPCTKGSVLQQCSSLGGANATSNKATYCIPDTNNTLDEICGWACEPSFSGDGGPALRDAHGAVLRPVRGPDWPHRLRPSRQPLLHRHAQQPHPQDRHERDAEHHRRHRRLRRGRDRYHAADGGRRLQRRRRSGHRGAAQPPRRSRARHRWHHLLHRHEQQLRAQDRSERHHLDGGRRLQHRGGLRRRELRDLQRGRRRPVCDQHQHLLQGRRRPAREGPAQSPLRGEPERQEALRVRHLQQSHPATS